MNKLIAFCINNRLISGLVIGLLCAVAFVSVKQLPIDVFPELREQRVTLMTEAPGLTADEVEAQLSIPLESAMSGLRYVTKTKSSSGRGLSFVWVDFEDGVDPYRVRQIIAERLGAIRSDLPDNTSTEISPVVSVTGEIALISITTPSQSLEMEVRQLCESTLRQQLLAIPGIGQVAILGGRLPQYRVALDPLKLTLHNLMPQDLIDAVSASQSLKSAGYITNYRGKEWPLRQQGRIQSLQAFRETAIPGTQLQLDDVADLSIAPAIRSGSAAYNQEAAVVLSVQKAPGGNTLELLQAMDLVLDRFESTALPAGTTLKRDGYRQSDFINISMESGRETVIQAAIIVICVIFFTLLSLRLAAITLIALPISLLLGLLVFPLFGLSLNIMTLGGLAVAVGDVVDNAVIFVENAWRRLRERTTEQSQTSILLQAGVDVVPSMVFSTIIIILVFAPLMVLTGIEGQFFRPMAIAYCVALVGSLVSAVTVIPLLMTFVKAPAALDSAPTRESCVVRAIKWAYTPILRTCMRWHWVVLTIAAGAVAGAIYLATTFGTTFLPAFHEGCYTLFVSATPGTSLEESEAIAQNIVQSIEQVPGVKSVVRRTGRAERDAHAEPVSSSEIQVRVDLRRDQAQLKAAFNQILKQIPGTSTMIGYPIAHRISAVLSGTNADITIHLIADDLARLRHAAQVANTTLKARADITDIQANREVLVDAITIKYKPFELQRYGLSRETIATQIALAFGGLKAGEVLRNTSRWDIVLQMNEAQRSSPDQLASHTIITPDGQRIPLNQLAEVYAEKTPNLIIRENGLRQALITCNPAPGANVGDIVESLRHTLDPQMQALGVAVKYGGTIQARDSMRQQLTLLGAILAVIIVLILYSVLKSTRGVLLILTNVPLALIGGILAIALFAGDQTPILSVASLAGFITLFGFAIRNGLLLLTSYTQLIEQGHSVQDAVMTGSLTRITPIIMTSLTTLLGLLPIVMARTQPGGEILAPLAIVQFGGLLSATLLNLIVLPAATLASARRAR